MRKIVFLLIAFCAVFSSKGQIYDPVDWSFTTNRLSDEKVELIFTAKIEEGWHIYAMDLPADEGPLPTEFNFKTSDNYSLVGSVKEGKYKTEYDPNFDMDLNFFEGTAVFKQIVEPKKEGDFTVEGELSFMVCDAERCLPPEYVPFEFKIQGAEAASVSNDDTAETGSEANSNSGLGLSGAMNAQQQIIDPIEWSISGEKTQKGYTVFFTAAIEEGWHLYAAGEENLNGPIPLSFSFDQENIAGDSTIQQPEPIVKFDQIFEMEVRYFEDSVTFEKSVQAEPGDVLSGAINFMLCDDERCIFPEPYAFEVQFTPTGVEIAGNEPEELKASSSTSFDYLRSSIDLGQPLTGANGCIGVEVDPSSSSETRGNLLNIFLLGFIGGFIALLTPCVFPMIPLTVSFFTKGSEDRKKGLMRAGLYGFCIVLIYLVLSIPFHVLDQVDENILNSISTNPWLNLGFFVIFIIFAISFFGYFEITIPSKFANKADSASSLGGLVGIFFMALTLALVSFSCTGPILGSLLASSLTANGGAIQLTVGMVGFGFALGIPFALFAAFPGMMRGLPKSGGWLNSVKVVLGFLELALALKFLSNADLVKHWGLLKIEPFLILWIIIFVLMALYIFGLIKFPHDSPVRKLSFFRVSFGVLVVAFVVYLASGFRYNESTETFKPLTLLSGLAPPVGYSILHPKDCPLNLDCEKDLDVALARAEQENKPLMIDFTGYACVNCRKMEESVWSQPEVKKMLQEEYIIVSLYVDDRKELPVHLQDTLKSVRTNKTKVIKTYGDRWSAFQIETFQSNSQPHYALITPDQKLLTTPVGYTPEADEYKAWLRCGLETFENKAEPGLATN